MKAYKPFFLAIGLVLAAGCAIPEPFQAKQPVMPPPAPAVSLKNPALTTGSLFVEASTDLYTDLRAYRVGDIVVVEVTENSKAKKKNDTKAERTNEYQAGIPYLLGYEDRLRLGSGSDPSKTNSPLVQADFKSKHDAKAELTKEDTMTTSIGCTVIEVMQNGNLILRGSRELQVNGETQYITLQGVVRPIDVTSQNTVLSTQLADAKIYYTGRGVLTDKQTPGWLARLFDHIWPF